MLKILGGLTFILAATGVVAITAALAAPAEKQKLLRHIVMYKFKPEVSATQVQEVVDTFAALPSKIDTIRQFEMGTNVSQEGKSDGFTHVFVVSFADEAGRDQYLEHPAHQAYVRVVKDRREKVLVLDYWTE
ncbi:MAG: Dabb family protein [Pirellulales bacterium]|nr:Dabb family protein [Pirellulales bacterium]